MYEEFEALRDGCELDYCSPPFLLRNSRINTSMASLNHSDLHFFGTHLQLYGIAATKRGPNADIIKSPRSTRNENDSTLDTDIR